MLGLCQPCLCERGGKQHGGLPRSTESEKIVAWQRRPPSITQSATQSEAAASFTEAARFCRGQQRPAAASETEGKRSSASSQLEKREARPSLTFSVVVSLWPENGGSLKSHFRPAVAVCVRSPDCLTISYHPIFFKMSCGSGL